MLLLIIFFRAVISLHPLSLCGLLILLALLMGLILNLTLSKWLGYSLMLIFLGGMIVIFLYIRTLSLAKKNPHFNTSAKFTSIVVGASLGAVGWTPVFEEVNFSFRISHLFHQTSNPNLLFLVNFLLVTLFTVVKLAEKNKGVLAKKW